MWYHKKILKIHKLNIFYLKININNWNILNYRKIKIQKYFIGNKIRIHIFYETEENYFKSYKNEKYIGQKSKFTNFRWPKSITNLWFWSTQYFI